MGAAQSAIDRAKRLSETGRDVVLVIDSLTQLARVYNQINISVGPSRFLSTGLHPERIEPLKRLLRTPRQHEGGGSLAILGTVDVDSGSRISDVVREELLRDADREIVWPSETPTLL